MARERDYGMAQPHSERSGAVTIVAIMSFVVGALVLLFGMCSFIGVAALTGEAGARGVLRIPELGAGMGLAIVVCVAIILWGVGAVLGGIGVMGRKQWGRILTLVLGGFAALVALLFIWFGVVALPEPTPPGGIPPAVPPPLGPAVLSFFVGLVFLGYTILAYLILLNPSHGAEFN